MTNPFRKPVEIRRRSAGAWVGMNWVAGPEEVVPILANVQPISPRELQDTETGKGGKSMVGGVKLYTDAQLYTAEAAQRSTLNPQPDIMIYKGERYIIASRGDYHATNSAASHFKYFATLEIQHAELTNG